MAFEKNMDENNNSRQVNCDHEDSNYIPKTISGILKKLSSISEFNNKTSELDFHLRSYEKELRKVDAFKRELPLCMQLLKEGIEKLEEEKLECEERERAKMSIEFSEKKSWLSTAQLWSTPVQYENNFDTRNQESFSSLISSKDKEEASSGGLFKSRGGAFLPYKKESRGLVRARPQQPHQQQPQRKQRRCWSPELHRLFVDALDNLGGAEVATPKQIREQMKLEGLTNDEVKSHLQKYRIHIRRLASLPAEPSGLPWFRQAQTSSNSGSSQDHHLHMSGLAKRVSSNGGNNMQENEAVVSESQSSKGKQVDRRF